MTPFVLKSKIESHIQSDTYFLFLEGISCEKILAEIVFRRGLEGNGI